MHLVPLFRELKSLIRHSTHSPEFKIVRDFRDNLNQVYVNYPPESEKGREGTEKLTQAYAQLLKLHREEARKPSNRIRHLQKKLEDLQHIFEIWNKYVTIVYMN